MLVDLHTHTRASDGIFSIRELLDYARKSSVKVLAVTDHDCVKAFSDTESIGLFSDIMLIKGIEFGCIMDGLDVHILAYNIDIEDASLLKKLDMLAFNRVERTREMLSKLAALGIEIPYEEVAAESEHIKGRLHLARLMVKKGFVSDENSAFSKYLGIGAPAYVPRKSLSVEESIELIASVGGVSVLAHPFVSLVSEDMIDRIIGYGINGIEVYYPEHNGLQRDFLKNKALANSLLVTGGSDFHGFRNGNLMPLGMRDYPDFLFSDFMDKIQKTSLRRN